MCNLPKNFLHRKCQRKIAHASRAEAQLHIDRLVTIVGTDRSTLTIYHCGLCGMKHIATKNKKLRGTKVAPRIIRTGGVLLAGR